MISEALEELEGLRLSVPWLGNEGRGDPNVKVGVRSSRRENSPFFCLLDNSSPFVRGEKQANMI